MKKCVISVAIFVFCLMLWQDSCLAENKKLTFGAIAVGKVSQVRQSLEPLMQYIGSEIGAEVTFETGKDYTDTIEKFRSGHFDFGYIGPSPYVIATRGAEGPDNFHIVAGLETNNKPYFHAVIIAAKDNDAINALEDLKGKRFAFGSRQSTLSCYMPCKMLMDAGVFDTLAEYDFLGKHDKVAQYVAMGRFDGGGIKEAVANKNLSHIKVIATSEPVYDFLIVAHKSMDPALVDQIRAALLKLDDPTILNSVKKGVTGFVETADGNYDGLRKVMEEVDRKLGPAQ